MTPNILPLNATNLHLNNLYMNVLTSFKMTIEITYFDLVLELDTIHNLGQCPIFIES